MNEHDAKENLQDMYDVALCRIKNGDARGAIYLPPETLDSYIIGIKALEKQIAKKPKGETDPMFGVITTVCPNCGNANLVNPFVISKAYDYCPNCGQRLDWSDIDE